MNKEETLNGLDAEIMDWFYECVEINFGVEMIQDSTDLRKILERHLDKHISKSELREKLEWLSATLYPYQAERSKEWLAGYDYNKKCLEENVEDLKKLCD